ncbi:MAG TPA: serine protease [Rhizomicrobium sp.]|jgi:S1-C subfamily serine protease|nr:serine protease [Rhizomicrobium sp.]
MRFPIAALGVLALAGCGVLSSGMLPSGQPASEFLNDAVARAFIPISGTSYVVMGEAGAGVVVEPGIAVTNAHVGEFLHGVPVIGKSHDYDLLFFRVDRQDVLPSVSPTIGERVIAYGMAVNGGLRQAQGVVRGLEMPVQPRCPGCLQQSAFVYIADAGPGFSGGPVVDAASGRLVGITFGYDDVDGQRRMYAYPMSRVHNELAALLHRVPSDIH